MTRLSSRDPDPYYWLTAQLAARGAQRSTWRLMAFVTIGFSTIPVIWAFTPPAAQHHWYRVLALGISACCVAMASQWMRHRWPSRTVSQICTVIASICIALANSLAADPVVGLLGYGAFVVLTIYVALFHSLRLLVLTWIIAAIAATPLVERLASTNLALAAGSALLLILTNVFAACTCRVFLQLIRKDDTPVDQLEPLTGMLTRQGFHQNIATLLGARSRQDDRYLVVIVANIDHFAQISSTRGSAQSAQSQIALAQCVRESVRREALVAHPGGAEFLVADVFTSEDPTPMSTRLRMSIANSAVDMTASIGAVSTPLGPLTPLPPDDVLEELLTIATTAMYEARAAGGNQTRHAINPSLVMLREDNTAQDGTERRA